MPQTTSFPPGPPSGPPPPPSEPPPTGPPPAGGPPPVGWAPRMERDPEDAVLVGVCAAVGRHTDTDPVLWRVAVAVLALFGGAGAVLYVLGWLLIPRRGDRRTVLERTLRRPDGSLAPGGVVVAVVAGVVLLAVLGNGPGIGAVLVLGVLGYLAVRDRRGPAPAASWAPPSSTRMPGPVPAWTPGGPTPPVPGTSGTPYETRPYETRPYETRPYAAPSTVPGTDVPAPGASGMVPETPYVHVGEPGSPDAPGPDVPRHDVPSWPAAQPAPVHPVPWPAPVPRQRRPRSRLGALTLSAATLLTGLLLALRLGGVDGLTAPRIVAAALLVVGAGLLVGTWAGRARWLLAVGLLLALLLGATAAASGAGLDDGLGDRTWTPTADGSYRLGAGQAVLDLRELTRTPVDVDARVAVGSLVVLVPDDVRLQVVGEVGFGSVFSTDLDGTLVDYGDGDDTDLRTAFVVGDAGDPTAGRIDLEVGMGEIEVRRVAA